MSMIANQIANSNPIAELERDGRTLSIIEAASILDVSQEHVGRLCRLKYAPAGLAFRERSPNGWHWCISRHADPRLVDWDRLPALALYGKRFCIRNGMLFATALLQCRTGLSLRKCWRIAGGAAKARGWEHWTFDFTAACLGPLAVRGEGGVCDGV
jgi:hypothetical protein